jgi:hypothetical protein
MWKKTDNEDKEFIKDLLKKNTLLIPIHNLLKIQSLVYKTETFLWEDNITTINNNNNKCIIDNYGIFNSVL